MSASPGVANRISMWDSAGRLFIQDVVQIVAPGSACSSVGGDVKKVSCVMPTGIKVKLKDGDDLLFSSSAIPTDVRAGTGDDQIFTGSGDDYVQGGGGHDYVATGVGNDRLLAGGGDDYLNGGPGPGAGSDSDVVSGGAGLDTGNYARRRTWPIVTYDNVANDGEAGESDNAKVDDSEKRPFNYEVDEPVLPASGELFVSRVWAGSAADFALETQPERDIQAIGYYNTDGLMTVAIRRLGETAWQHPTVADRSGHNPT